MKNIERSQIGIKKYTQKILIKLILLEWFIKFGLFLLFHNSLSWNKTPVSDSFSQNIVHFPV